MSKALTAYLAGFITGHKKSKIEEILSKRTRHVTLVMEHLHKAHNGSAVLRTAECFGIQDIHIIEQSNKYKANPYVTRGSSKWIDIKKYPGEGIEGVQKCYSALRDNGYQIVATAPSDAGLRPEQISINNKIALIFGNEYEGLSKYALENADQVIALPMHGFTESFNISVTAAICLYTLIENLHKSEINWRLTEEEKETIRLQWYKGVIKHSDVFERNFFHKMESGGIEDLGLIE